MERQSRIRFVKGALVVFLVLVAMVWAKTYYAGHEQYKEGEKNFAKGDVRDAITNYETAIHMYTPFGGYVSASAQRLWEIGQGLEQAGDLDWALIAYRSLRSSFYAVRSFYTPGKDWIERTEAQIDKVLAAQKEQKLPGAGREAVPPKP